jgi:lipoprotein-anchoring transpeptidase ErfK/SrfK
MSRRWIIFALVPALIGTMVGVGVAAWRPVDAVKAQEAPVEVAAEPTEEVSLRPAPPEDPWDTIYANQWATPAAEEDEAAEPEEDETTEEATPVATYDVAAVQQRLAELKYYGGPIDGTAGGAMASSVMAFQKVNGLAADGGIGPQTLAALENPATPALKGGAATRIEVDLTKQVLYYVQGNQLQRIMPVSSGNGASYSNPGGGTARALTPVGTYHIQRRISGVRNAPLGTLYDPLYFYQGWAIHGSNSVPAYPASHGCVRVTRSDAVWLFSRAPVGTQVVLYGGTHTFSAGSSAPGTSTPAGDTATEPSPSPTPAPSPTQTASPKPAETTSPSPSPSASPKPSPSPSPTPTPTPTPSEEPTEPAEAEDG